MGGQDYSSGGFEAEGEFPLVKGVFFFWKETLVIKVEEFLVRLGDSKVSKRGVFQVDFILHMDPVLHGVCHRLTREATLPLSRRCLGRESPMPALTTTTAATSLLPLHPTISHPILNSCRFQIWIYYTWKYCLVSQNEKLPHCWVLGHNLYQAIKKQHSS